ncbi:hypothetical protein [Amnibacterium sp.]|uniref:hypothetical protein n=1 Tax=Amnibacterium sp. TaxID=1872496 RepID=UPI002612F24A|nr:hypothetical protein [Amnibacterium sp.]MCU1473179.1 hypothetical protein [Amnibacterium sp.]
MTGSLLRDAAAAGVALAYVVLVIAALLPAPLLFLVFAVLLVLAELWLSRQMPDLLPRLLRTQLGVRFRLLSLDVLTAVLAARFVPERSVIVALAVVAVALLHGGRDAAGIFARRREWRRGGGPVSWRNLAVPGLPHPVVPREVAALSVPLALLTLLLPLGFAVGEATDRPSAALVAELAVIAVVALYIAGRIVQYLLLNRLSHDAVRAKVQGAIEQLAPQVVVHFSGRRGTVEQVLLWTPVLRGLGRPCLVLVREPTHIAALDGCGVPVVFAPRSQDVELFMVPSVRLALYPSDVTNINNHLIRVPGIFDVLIGHGDSDEPENRSPIARMYDEIWVAGPEGRDRYAWPASGVRKDRIREIGPIRPQPSEPVPSALGDRPIVLYAPTWENVLDSTDLSSLVERGADVLDALLARQDVRVLFAPAAPTGARLQDYADAVETLGRRVAAGGLEHAVLTPGQVPAALAQAAFAVLDVSPLVSEAIRLDLPFAACTIRGRTPEAMRTMFPTLGAGAVLEHLPEDVFRALDDALGPDVRAPQRAALRRRLDGDETGDVAQRFGDAVTDAIAAQHGRRAFARPATG